MPVIATSNSSIEREVAASSCFASAGCLPLTPCMRVLSSLPDRSLALSLAANTGVSECGYSDFGRRALCPEAAICMRSRAGVLSERRGGGIEPQLRQFVHLRSHFAADASVIVVQPAQLVSAKHADVDQPAIDRRQRQCLESIHRLLRAADVGAGHQFQVLDPDTVGICLVVAG